MPTPITDEQLFAYANRAKGKVVVITGAFQVHVPCIKRTYKEFIAGAASGIGRESALTFARHG
jgi:hypothetical protein